MYIWISPIRAIGFDKPNAYSLIVLQATPQCLENFDWSIVYLAHPQRYELYAFYILFDDPISLYTDSRNWIMLLYLVDIDKANVALMETDETEENRWKTRQRQKMTMSFSLT